MGVFRSLAPINLFTGIQVTRTDQRRTKKMPFSGLSVGYPKHSLKGVLKKDYSFLITTAASRAAPIAAMIVVIPTGVRCWTGAFAAGQV